MNSASAKLLGRDFRGLVATPNMGIIMPDMGMTANNLHLEGVRNAAGRWAISRTSPLTYGPRGTT